ncbi:MAG: DUF362 domain-containing protein [Myxococcota bacterium]|nr:DUF362 domain-containing protein [Myxococcota bacterium]
MSNVYFISSNHSEDQRITAGKVAALWRRAGLDAAFQKGDLAALKVHVGEPGCNTALSPKVTQSVVQCLQAAGTQPFLTDSAVLYKSPRDNGVGHIRVAEARGFGLSNMDAPFIPADGLNGSDEIALPVDGKHYQTVPIAAAIVHARSALILSHATGHLGTGLGAALKNLGMGCSSKKAKLSQHFGQQPRVHPRKCRVCEECFSWCPSGAIKIEQTAVIDRDKCIGCGECIAVCLHGAVTFDWSIMGRELQERIVEHAAAIARAKPGRICYITEAQSITKDCDCLGKQQVPLMDDIGLFASFDPVAIDAAVMDAIIERTGQTLESMSYPKTDGTVQVAYAEALGLGSRRYELIAVEADALDP